MIKFFLWFFHQNLCFFKSQFNVYHYLLLNSWNKISKQVHWPNHNLISLKFNQMRIISNSSFPFKGNSNIYNKAGCHKELRYIRCVVAIIVIRMKRF